ncbi:hypothetical protein HMPREF1057_02777 [Bacteroides finegoldii CL09T03C10]|uniref:Uncharacterized protein n=1 Tax=Bacteroides finegoldii CL09T03C10 TaxID=997888 RepID=K5BSM9_9BACE|nr:hypothetical protein HMPREF1057_02777 [Bacteroides finegoldii CL09T03C10]
MENDEPNILRDVLESAIRNENWKLAQIALSQLKKYRLFR